MSDAYQQLTEALVKGEVIEGICFGEWGWSGYREPKPSIIPRDKQGIVLSKEEAKPLMKGWSLYSDFGAPMAYAMYVWTNKQVVWITQYDGSTALSSMPRNPTDCEVKMPGG